jgi:hypothetical protein
MAQIINNIIVWMGPYCAQQLLGVRKKQNPFESKLMSMDSKLKSIENQLKVN